MCRYFFLTIIVTLSFFLKIVNGQVPLVGLDQVTLTGLNATVDLVNPNDGSDRFFLVQQSGIIRIVSGGSLLTDPFLDVSGDVLFGGEQGLLSLVFSPDYETNGYFFIYYNSNATTAGNLEIARYQVSADSNVANAASKKVLINIPHPSFDNHNGGKLNFGSDGTLYVGTGDGGSGDDPSNNAQNGNSLLGKMLRLAVNDSTDTAPFYVAPADNPYTDDPAIRGEIFALGLRNPFRWSFDRVGTGPWDMWIGDVGQNAWEEVNHLPGGIQKTNFGWRCFEATHDNPAVPDCNPDNYVAPVFEYDHSNANGGRSITGGMVYRGSEFPSLVGWYVTADFITRNAWVLKREANGSYTSQMQNMFPAQITAFAEDNGRELYAVSYSGTIYRVNFTGLLPATLEKFTAVTQQNNHVISWKTVFEQNIDRFVVEFSSNGSDYIPIGTLRAKNSSSGYTYTLSGRIPVSEHAYYRLKTIDRDGSYKFSDVIYLKGRTDLAALITPTVITEGTVTIVLKRPFRNLFLVDMNGRIVRSMTLGNDKREIKLDVSALPKQVYILKLQSDAEQLQQKIFIGNR